MSGDRPFARVSDPFDNLRPLWFGNANPMLGQPCTPPGYGLIAAAVNEQESARERKAAAKALREAADGADRFHVDAMESLGHHDGTLSDATRQRIAKWLRTRADQVEKGEA